MGVIYLFFLDVTVALAQAIYWIYLASDYGFYLMIIQIKAISNYSIQHPGEAQEPDQQYWTKALSKQRTVSYLVASSNHAHH